MVEGDFPGPLSHRRNSVTMALDARHRSSLYTKLVPLLGEDDANALMSEFPASEADELVTKQFLRAEMAELRLELFGEIEGVRGEIAGLRTEMVERFHQQTLWLGGAIAAWTGLLAALTRLT